MRVNRWPQGDFDLEPGDMVCIGSDSVDGTWAQVVAGAEEQISGPQSTSWIPSGPGLSTAMFLGEETREDGLRLAQVLHGGQILNVRASDIEPVDLADPVFG